MQSSYQILPNSNSLLDTHIIVYIRSFLHSKNEASIMIIAHKRSCLHVNKSLRRQLLRISAYKPSGSECYAVLIVKVLEDRIYESVDDLRLELLVLRCEYYAICKALLVAELSTFIYVEKLDLRDIVAR